MISFVSKGFPYQIEELFILTVYCMYSQLTFSLISLFLTATYLLKARYSALMLKVPLDPSNQSIC